MKEITKKDKVNFLKSYLNTTVGMTSDFDFENEDHQMFIDVMDEYTIARQILIDYDPESANEFSDDFSVQINKWNDEASAMSDSTMG